MQKSEATAPLPSVVRERIYASKTLGRVFIGLMFLLSPAYIIALVVDVDQRMAYSIWLCIHLVQHLTAYFLSKNSTLKASAVFYIAVTHLVFPVFAWAGIVNDPITLVYFLIPVSLTGFVFGAKNMLLHSLLLLPYFLVSVRGDLESQSVLAVFVAIFICSWLTMTMFRYWERIGQIRREGLRQANLHLQRANRSKTTLLENMSHEVLTPMTSILGFSELLKAEAKDQETEHALDMIIQSGNRLRTMLQSVLEIAHIEGGELDIDGKSVLVNDVMETVAEILRLRARDKKLVMEVNLCDELTEIRGSKSALTRVFYNVIENAIVYTKTGKIVVETKTDDEWVSIKVSDTGPGMSASFKDEAFEPFKQESEGVGRLYEGVGIGLTIAQQLVSLMNGQIFVDTQKGVGTQVTMKFPLLSNLDYEEKSIPLIDDKGIASTDVFSRKRKA